MESEDDGSLEICDIVIFLTVTILVLGRFYRSIWLNILIHFLISLASLHMRKCKSNGILTFIETKTENSFTSSIQSLKQMMFFVRGWFQAKFFAKPKDKFHIFLHFNLL